MENTKVGYIGLGHMGYGMAANLLRSLGALYAWNRSRGKVDRIVSEGAVSGGSNEEMARICDVLILSLPSPKEVREVVAGQLIPNGKEGQWILDTSTIDPQTSREMGALAAEKGIHYVDCPVSGGKAGSEAGTLTFMIGMSEEEAAPVRKYFDIMGDRQFYMGGIGNGVSIKLINNFMSFSTAVINAEAIDMAEEMGVPIETFYTVVMASSGGNNNLKGKFKKIVTNDLEASFTVNLLLKDLELAADLCRKAGIPNFSCNNAIQWFRMAQRYKYDGKDASCLVHLFREMSHHDPNGLHVQDVLQA